MYRSQISFIRIGKNLGQECHIWSKLSKLVRECDYSDYCASEEESGEGALCSSRLTN